MYSCLTSFLIVLFFVFSIIYNCRTIFSDITARQRPTIATDFQDGQLFVVLGVGRKLSARAPSLAPGCFDCCCWDPSSACGPFQQISMEAYGTCRPTGACSGKIEGRHRVPTISGVLHATRVGKRLVAVVQKSSTGSRQPPSTPTTTR